jgi:signal-transduction protein with cAMP-binding, CBS, and nucleotidyltransferase domain
MTIAAILSGRDGNVWTAEPHESVGEVVTRLAENRIGIIYGVARHGSAFLAKTVGETMTSPAITVTSDTQILSALSMMTKRRIRHLPVVEDNRLTGFVSIGDLVKHRIEKIEAEAAAMRDYISMA